ncbi:DUF167 domain-containing protein [Candidatus Woesearchaeota archaeon]|nr:MAG: DUF167 domain-containing protein [Candidatus Woesearchaeota archaeon]
MAGIQVIDEFKKEIAKGRVLVRVRPNVRESCLAGFDDGRKVWLLDIAAPAEDNQANVEVVRFLSRMIGSRVRIRSGLTSKQKYVELAGKLS